MVKAASHDQTGHGTRWLNGERKAALVLTGFSSLLLITSLRYGLFTDGQPGPGLFPAMISGSLWVLAAVWLLSPKAKPQHHFNDELEEAASHLLEEFVEVSRDGWRRIATVILLSVGYLFLLERLGFLITMTAYFLLLMRVVAQTKWWVSIAITIAFTGFIHVGANLIGITLPDPLGIVTGVNY